MPLQYLDKLLDEEKRRNKWRKPLQYMAKLLDEKKVVKVKEKRYTRYSSGYIFRLLTIYMWYLNHGFEHLSNLNQ
jgi:hypothetical protein